MAEFPAEAVVDIRAIKANVHAVRRQAGAGVKVMACVKANAYGHGQAPVVRALAECGVEMFAVANAAEALQVAVAASAPVLVFGSMTEEELAEVVPAGVRVTLNSSDDLRRAERVAERVGCPAIVHVNVDTGMGRLGVGVDEAEGFVASAAGNPHCRLEGVYTHFPCSDERDLSFSEGQIARFDGLLKRLAGRGVKVPLAHMANSGGILGLCESRGDMVRPGIMVYGYYPSPEARRTVDLTPALTLTTRVLAVRSVKRGETVSYGRTFVAQRPLKVAVLAIGYGDGLPRALSNRGVVVLRGRPAPIIGRVCMDLTMADVTDIDAVAFGDEAVVLSPDREAPNSVEAVASLLDTIPYELTCQLTPRVRRVYRE